MTRSEPPRLAMSLLTRFLPEDDPLVGDLVEECLSGRRQGWFWLQTASALAAHWRRPRRSVRPLHLVSAPSRVDVDPRPEWPHGAPGGPLAYLSGGAVAGVGSLGLLAVILLVAVVVPQIWMLVLTSMILGTALGVYLVRRTARRIDAALSPIGRSMLFGDRVTAARR